MFRAMVTISLKTFFFHSTKVIFKNDINNLDDVTWNGVPSCECPSLLEGGLGGGAPSQRAPQANFLKITAFYSEIPLLGNKVEMYFFIP